MLITSVDVGYTKTKSVSRYGRRMFSSTIKEGAIDINKSIVVETNGVEYTIGEKGAFSVDLNKIQDPTFKTCLYTAILQHMQYNNEDINLVTGLPIAYYSKQKHCLIEELQGKEIFMKYNGISKLFTINKCLVFPQSAGLFILYPELFKGDVIVIDIGGMTVDVSYFEGLKLVKYATYPMGMLKLYGKMIQEVNALYGLNLDILDAEKIIRNGLCIEDMEVGYDVATALADHAEDLIRPIKLEFPYKTAQKINIGGGSDALKNYLSKGSIYPGNNIYANAEAFYAIGVSRFDH